MAVGRPSVIVYVVVKSLVNEDWLFLPNVNIEEARLFVGKRELLAVGGPDRPVESCTVRLRQSDLRCMPPNVRPATRPRTSRESPASASGYGCCLPWPEP